MKRAAEMLLGGATLLGQPCPYCGGVRVMKQGYALCVGCGREPEKRTVTPPPPPPSAPPSPLPSKRDDATSKIHPKLEASLKRKLESLSTELELEKDYKKQQDILESITAILDTLEKTNTDA